jgi:hypothetical protein
MIRNRAAFLGQRIEPGGCSGGGRADGLGRANSKKIMWETMLHLERRDYMALTCHNSTDQRNGKQYNTFPDG